MTFIYDLLEKSAEAAISFQSDSGYLAAGNNGPYDDDETPVRNTSHWLISFLKAYEITKDDKFKISALKALNYLLSKEARPMDATFWHRKKPIKDFTNGVMGQAWTLEALVYAYKVFQDKKILKIAEDVFLLHPYDNKKKAWKIVNVDGSIRGFDPTFNHQLWFAAIGLLLGKHGNKTIIDQSKDFIDSIDSNLEIYNNGLIKHKPLFYLKNPAISKTKILISQSLKRSNSTNDLMYQKSIGYHSFNLYALGLISLEYSDLIFFQSNKFQKILNLLQSDEFKKELDTNKYGYPYNPPGLELSFAMQRFSSENFTGYYMKEQVNRYWDNKNKMLNKKNKFDLNTAAARIYEMYQLENFALD